VVLWRHVVRHGHAARAAQWPCQLCDIDDDAFRIQMFIACIYVIGIKACLLYFIFNIYLLRKLCFHVPFCVLIGGIALRLYKNQLAKS